MSEVSPESWLTQEAGWAVAIGGSSVTYAGQMPIKAMDAPPSGGPRVDRLVLVSNVP